MPPSQDPPTGEPPRLDQDNVDQRPIYLVYGTRPDGDSIGCRPVFLVYGLPLGLCFTGALIACVGLQYTRHLHPWEDIGYFFLLLSVSAIIGVPGLLVAIRHPWGASLGLKLPLRHPRLGGLVQAWIGLIFLGGALLGGVDSFISLPYFDTRYGIIATYIVMFLGVGIPVLALYLFGRRR